ncbi:MAG: glutamate--tRNA ligase [Candidatus Cloacimonetes bacterium]|nr:glutamate--tRNA ligase [Candidatus Cloacimonadota bacterium]MCF7884783.1 glutamate--tRNA ligase [Candidatus Cloacimonadota bacterium]
MSNKIKVRFAPSPTGYLHVGGLRTALYDYIYARKVGGKFVLRIEDTDRNRFVEGAVENLINSLKQVGLEYDEGPEVGGDCGPYFQSERTEIYQKYTTELLEKDAAYYCFCTPEELEQQREEQKEKGQDTRYNGHCRNLSKDEIEENLKAGKPYVIRLKVPREGDVVFYDLVRERVSFPWSQIDDQVIMKSDGFPTYHLANVVDDHLMGITHVIRGEEWLPSTPKHIFMYNTFGWKNPKWVHLPLILNPDKTKLSKRQGDVATEDFLKKGYLPEALLNFIALLGWHSKGDRELFTVDELINEFSLKRLSKSGAVFDIEKLKWMNSHYLKTLELGYIAIKAKPYFEEAGFEVEDQEFFLQIVDFARERVNTLAEMPKEASPFFKKPEFNDEDKQILAEENSRNIFNFWIQKLEEIESFDDEQISNLIKQTTEETGAKGKNLYFPLRLVLFGSVHGPEIPLIIKILGKEEAVERFKNGLR